MPIASCSQAPACKPTARLPRRAPFFFAIVLLVASIPALPAPKTDVVLMQNGDRITCEIKGLDRGRLTVKTDDLGTIDVEWDRVARVVTNQQMQIETVDGHIYFGSLVPPDIPERLRLKGADASKDFELLDVVRMAPIETKLIKRFSGDISAGYSLVSANAQEQFNFDFSTAYRKSNFLGQLGVSIQTTSSNADPASRRDSALLETYRILENRWFWGALFQGDRNDQLGIEQRISAGLAGGRYVVQNNSELWRLLVGVVEAYEKDFDTPEATTSTQALFATSFDWFRYHKPEVDLSTTLAVLPNLSDWGKWRGTYTLAFKWQVYKDFFFRIKFTGDYNSSPPEGNFSKTDYSLSASLGSTF